MSSSLHHISLLSASVARQNCDRYLQDHTRLDKDGSAILTLKTSSLLYQEMASRVGELRKARFAAKLPKSAEIQVRMHVQGSRLSSPNFIIEISALVRYRRTRKTCVSSRISPLSSVLERFYISMSSTVRQPPTEPARLRISSLLSLFRFNLDDDKKEYWAEESIEGMELHSELAREADANIDLRPPH